MKVLITGVGGFIGRTIASRLLADGHQVVGLGRNLALKPLPPLVREQAQLVEASVVVASEVLEAATGCDVIFHCAAVVGAQQYVQRPVETMEIETRSLRFVCAAALRHGAKVVYMSSSAVYGQLQPAGQIAEDVIAGPVSSYGVAKRYNELYLAAQHAENGLSSVSLRIFNVYGPGQSESMVVPRFIRLCLSDAPLKLYGGGEQTRDFVHVDDVAQAAVICATQPIAFDTFNVATGTEVSIRSLAEKCVAATGAHSPIIIEATPALRSAVEVDRSVGSPARLFAHTGFRPEITLEHGLQTCVAAARATV
ncbi:MAG: NAD-dependent epimerase/dehydratase family protein [Bacteroidota bacterium]